MCYLALKGPESQELYFSGSLAVRIPENKMLTHEKCPEP